MIEKKIVFKGTHILPLILNFKDKLRIEDVT
jgi:hypothetical protein